MVDKEAGKSRVNTHCRCNGVSQPQEVVPGPNILVIEASDCLLAKHGLRPLRSNHDGDSKHVTSAKSGFVNRLRARGYYTGQAVCYLLGEDDALPAVVSGFDNTYYIFVNASAQPEGSAAGTESHAICAQRVGGLNDEVVAYVIHCLIESIAQQKPFYVFCGVEVSPGREEFDRCVSQLRLSLQQLGVEQNTLLLQRMVDPVPQKIKVA